MTYLVGYSLLAAILVAYAKLLRIERMRNDRMTMMERREQEETANDLRTW